MPTIFLLLAISVLASVATAMGVAVWLTPSIVFHEGGYGIVRERDSGGAVVNPAVQSQANQRIIHLYQKNRNLATRGTSRMRSSVGGCSVSMAGGRAA